MNAQASWERQNEAHLGAALHWLRLRLRRLAGGTDAGAAEAPMPVEQAHSLRNRLFGNGKLQKALPPPAAAASLEAELAQAASAMTEAAAADPPPAVHILAHRLGLSAFEQQVLLLCAAVEFDTRIAALCARAQGNPVRPYPTFALAVALFDDPAWDVLSPERPLRYWRLIEINQPGAEPLTTSALRADERIVNYLKGLNYVDDRFAPLLVPFDAGAGIPLPPSQQRAAATVEHALRHSAGNGSAPVVQLVGTDALSKQLVACRVAEALHLNLYRLPVELLPQPSADLETLARLWRRECALLPVALFVDAHEADAEPRGEGSADTARPLHRFLAHSQGVVLVSTRELRAGLGAVVQAVEVDKPTPAEQQAAWTAALGEQAGDSAALLAGQYNLNASTIERIVRATLADVGADGEPEPQQDAGAPEVRAGSDPLHRRLWEACLLSTGPRLDRLAERLHPVATWDDIVLPEEEMHLLRQLAGQVARRATVYDRWGFRQRMNRGLGISALFAGESGTGKTMAAEVVANALALNLYRIDLSAVVSKYIGETEKNLRRLFDAAEDGGAILFFDEADALFGKRSDVRDSHDRYANIEINYLLQRIEAYRGLAILATNMRGALDQAFMRRLRFVVTFPFPGKPQRRAIWQRAWPTETPVDGIDYDHLARFNLTGGGIANIALNAAFLAAEHDAPVTMPLVLDAVRTELRKLERPCNEAELRWDAPRRPVLAAQPSSESSSSARVA